MDKELVIAALRFRRCALFETLNDSQIFAVRLTDGQTGYCCCMGNGREHFALALYRGTEGFNTYLNSIKSGYDTDPLKMFERHMTFHAINCDFENAAGCVTGKEERAAIKKIAAEEGIKMCRPKGWPDFHVMAGPVQYIGIPEETDRRDMTLALQAGCEVTHRIEGLDYEQLVDLGFDDFYATDQGGKVIPMLCLQPDGIWSWDKTTTPPLTETEFTTPLFDNPSSTFKIRAIKHTGTYQCCLAHSPMPVADGDARYYPVDLLAVMDPQGIPPFMPRFIREQKGWETEILDNLATEIIESGRCPASIETDDERTYALLKDFCEKTGIKLSKTAYATLVRELWMFMQTMMGNL